MNRQLPLVLVLLAGCDAISGDDRPLATLAYPDARAIAAPDTVTAGVPFDVTVATAGSGCEERIETDVSVRGGVVEIRPYVVPLEPATRVCSDVYIRQSHATSATVDAPGRAVVRAVGRRTANGRPGEIEVERTVVVVAR